MLRVFALPSDKTAGGLTFQLLFFPLRRLLVLLLGEPLPELHLLPLLPLHVLPVDAHQAGDGHLRPPIVVLAIGPVLETLLLLVPVATGGPRHILPVPRLLPLQEPRPPAVLLQFRFCKEKHGPLSRIQENEAHSFGLKSTSFSE